MDAREAREHLEMVDRILSEAEQQRNYRPWSWALVVLGSAAALIQVGFQLGQDGHGYGLATAGAVVMFLGYITIGWNYYSYRRSAARVPASEVRIGRASGAVWLAVGIAFFGQPHIWGAWASGAIWNLGAAIQMLMLGFLGHRRSLIGGLVLAFSIVAANYVSAPGYVLASGFVLGYVLPGALNLLERDERDARG